MACVRAPTSPLRKLQVLLDPPVINQLTQVRGHVSVLACPSSLLSSHLGPDPHTLTPEWQPTSRAPPIVTVSHSSLDALDVSITPPPMASLPHTRQQPSTRTLNVSKVD